MAGEYDWTIADAPKNAQLTGVESADDTAFVAGKRGLLAERRRAGEWAPLFDTGATGDGRGLLDLSLSDDGKRIWFSGYSGTFGYYDRVTGTTKPHAGPYDLTSNLCSVTVRGDAGEEAVHAVDRSGRALRVRMDGEALEVKGVSVPGDGTGFAEIVDDDGVLYAADESGRLYRSEDGRRWEQKRLAETTLMALSRTDAGLVAIDDGGTVYKHISLFGEGKRTKRTQPGISAPQELEALDERIVSVGDGGSVLVITEDGRAVRSSAGTGKTFYGAEVMADGTVIAAGAAGTIAEGVPRR